VDANGITTLNAATLGNDTATIRLLVDAGVDVNAPGSALLADAPPLVHAAGNGNVEAVKLLLAKGAKVNGASSRDKLMPMKNGPLALGGFTALLAAPGYGPPELVKTLLDAGADANATDVRGMTPLMFAAATDRQNPEIIRMLIAHGAGIDAKSLAGETALDWSRKNGFTAVTDSLSGKEHPPMPGGEGAPSAQKAVERSVALLEASAGQFFVNSGCFACHAQAATDFAVSAARARGIQVNEKAAHDRLQQVTALLNPAGPMLMERLEPPGSPDTLVYVMESLARSGFAPNQLTDFLAASIASQQWEDGRWHLGGITRAPIEDGDFSRTALAIRALKMYGTPGRAAENQERIERAKQWLMSAEAVTAEDRNMRLIGVAAAGARGSTLRNLAEPILSRQRPDGGWGQREELPSDAYATGQTLFALAEAGVIKPGEEAYQKGVKFLLSTQRSDGSWYVASRAAKIQPYFESGFPYGDDQWISAAATGWAANALALSIGER
jgi:hypothetical protein